MLTTNTKKTTLRITTFSLMMLGVKLLTLMRHTLKLHYLGTGIQADIITFFWKLPNLLGIQIVQNALIPAAVPVLVGLLATNNQEEANRVLSGLLLFKCLAGALLCASIMYSRHKLFSFLAPGLFSNIATLVESSWLVPVILVSMLILCASSCLATAQQAKGDYFSKAWSRLLLGISSITGLLCAVSFDLSVVGCVFFVLCGGIGQFALYGMRAWHSGYRLYMPTQNTLHIIKNTLVRFIVYAARTTMLHSTDLLEVRCASLLAPGCLALYATILSIRACITYPLTTTLSTVLFPHLCHFALRSHKRLGYYLLESAKLLLSITLPLSLVFCFFSHSFFHTVFYQWLHTFSAESVDEATHIFSIFACGFFLSAIRQLVLTTYYALGNATGAFFISAIGVAVRWSLICMYVTQYGACGLAYAWLCSSICEIVLFFIFLPHDIGFGGYFKRFVVYSGQYGLLLTGLSLVFFVVYEAIKKLISIIMPAYAPFFTNHLGLWIWVVPLCIGALKLLNQLTKLHKLSPRLPQRT